jgi:Zn-dependent protease with chaperone function
MTSDGSESGFFESFSLLSEAEKNEVNEAYSSHYAANLEGLQLYYTLSVVSKTIASHLLLAVLLVFVAGVAGKQGLSVVLLLYSMFAGFITLRPNILANLMQTKEVTESKHPDLYSIFTEVCESLDVSPSNLTFAIEKGGEEPAKSMPSVGSVYIKNELLPEVTEEELKAFLSHEILHIQYDNQLNRTIVFFTTMVPILLFTILYWIDMFPISALVVLFVTARVVSQGIANSFMRQIEKKADSQIPDELRVPYAKAMLRLTTRNAPHIDSDFWKIIYTFIDEHPPINERLCDILDESEGTIKFDTEAERQFNVDYVGYFLKLPMYIGMGLIALSYLYVHIDSIPVRLATYGFIVSIVWFPLYRFITSVQDIETDSGVLPGLMTVGAVLFSIVQLVVALVISYSVQELTVVQYSWIDIVGISVLTVYPVGLIMTEIADSVIFEETEFEIESVGSNIGSSSATM